MIQIDQNNYDLALEMVSTVAPEGNGNRLAALEQAKEVLKADAEDRLQGIPCETCTVCSQFATSLCVRFDEVKLEGTSAEGVTPDTLRLPRGESVYFAR